MKKIFLALCAVVAGFTACGQGDAKYTTQNNAEFAGTIADPAIQLVDVRTPAEFSQGHIPNAVNIDIQGTEFDEQAARLDKNRPVALYCRSGMRSRKAAARLAAEGFQVYNLGGGILGWDGKTTK